MDQGILAALGAAVAIGSVFAFVRAGSSASTASLDAAVASRERARHVDAAAIVGALLYDGSNHPYYVRNNRRYYTIDAEGYRARKADQLKTLALATLERVIREARPITHAVKFYERGERPLEIVSSSQ